MINYYDIFKVSKLTILIVTCSKSAKSLLSFLTCSKLAKWLIIMNCSKLAMLNKAIQGTFFKSQKVKIDSKDMDLYFNGLWWLIKQSMTLLKSQKKLKKVT